MKKILSILLMIVYTAASSGTVISAHYCMGDLASVTIGENINDACEFCGMEGQGCCHDLPQVIKIDNSVLEGQAIAGFDFHPAYLSVPVSDLCDNTFAIKTCSAKCFFHQQFIKPPPYLLNCNFRI